MTKNEKNYLYYKTRLEFIEELLQLFRRNNINDPKITRLLYNIRITTERYLYEAKRAVGKDRHNIYLIQKEKKGE